MSALLVGAALPLADGLALDGCVLRIREVTPEAIARNNRAAVQDRSRTLARPGQV